MEKWAGSFGPKTDEKIASKIAKWQTYYAQKYIGNKIKVPNGKAFFDVELSHQTCTCYGWQMSRIPCKHACSTINLEGLEVDEFVDHWFRKDC